MKLYFIGCLLLVFVSCKEASTKKAETFLKDNTEVVQQDSVLVFTKTAGYRHKSIEAGVELIKTLGEKHQFTVHHTEDSLQFNFKNLKKYNLILFLSTTLDVLGEPQQQDFQKYIQTGGSFMGIHAASDTEFNWPWYGKLVGAYFENHPSGTPQAVINVVDTNHIATKGLPKKWTRTDEWYNFKEINPNINVLMNLDETTYEGGTNGKNHPIAWYHEFDGGRSFYTGGGHSIESFSEPLFVQHILGGIFYCLKRTE
ncbi:ThuA domain-containing protein [Joostella sp. CR20]|uniref:ThuA domain-containing protein n=1 Tax=Joostella sp. CR20 TaxID=2804312 RepID=UPI00313D964C